MNVFLSNKIKAVSFFAMVLVVFIHGTTMMFNFGNTIQVKTDLLNICTQSFVSDGLARIAVPIFFAISGFLFFQGRNLTFSVYIDKLKKRVRSLFIPYLSWSLISLLIYWLLQQMPFSKPFFVTRLVANFSFAQLVNVIFFDPLAYQLWFIKDLMFLVLFTPLMYVCIRYTKWLLAVIAIYLWMSNSYLYLFQNMSFCFFIIGATLSLYPISISKPAKFLTFFLLFTWLLLCAIRTYLIAFSILPHQHVITNSLQFASIFIGIIAVWYSYDLLMQEKLFSAWWMSIFSCTFFVYAFHEPTLTILRKASFYFSDKSVTSLFLLYWFCPILSVVIAIFFAKILQRITPFFYTLITGGR